MSSIKKVRNWSEYNKALVKRGEIIFSFDKKYLESLYYNQKQQRGGARQYSDLMYEFILNIKVLFRLTWRSAIGFARGLLKKALPGATLKIPDYAHACRQASLMNLKVKHFAPVCAGMEIAFDSTGVNIYNISGWHQKKYGKNNLYKKRINGKKFT